VGRDNPFRYASGYADDATGLYKFGARYYDPSLGRWTQRDPLPGPMGFPSKVDRYSYVGDNPLSRTDPTGKDFLDDLADAAKCAAIVAALDYAGQYFVGAVLTGEEAIAAAILVIGSAAVEYYIEHCQ
jgi:RHS repeat-associated protein